jgi:hypothetical protein
MSDWSSTVESTVMTGMWSAMAWRTGASMALPSVEAKMMPSGFCASTESNTWVWAE